MENYSRRHILKTSLWTFGGLCFGLPGIIASSKEPRNGSKGLLNWEEFVDKLEARGQDPAHWRVESGLLC